MPLVNCVRWREEKRIRLFLKLQIKYKKKENSQVICFIQYFLSFSGHILEVYDLPGGMMQADADKLLKDLVTSGGAQLQFMHQENIQYQTDTASLPVSSFHKILAIFPSSAGANQILQTHSNSKYKLRPSTSDSIGVRT